MATNNNDYKDFGVKKVNLRYSLDYSGEFCDYIKAIKSFVEICHLSNCFRPTSMDFEFDITADIIYKKSDCESSLISSITFYEKNNNGKDDVTKFIF